MTTAKKRPTIITMERVIIGLLIIGLVVFASEEVRPHLPGIEAWIAEQGIWAPIIFIILMVVLSIVCFPLDIIFIAGGLIFNLGKGSLYVAIGIYIGQSINFWLGRTLLRKRVERWIENKPKLRGVHRAMRKQGIKLLFMLRMAPIPASPTSYLMGTTPLKYWQFLVANSGLLPVAFASMYFGYAAVHATKTVGNEKHHFNLHDAGIFGGLLLAIVVVAYLGHIARKILRQAEENAGDSEEEEV